MTFYDYARGIISERLKSRDTLKKVIEKIKGASANGQIAFYPCGKFTRAILDEIKRQEPELLPRIIGGFDKSHEADLGEDVSIYDIKRLDEFKDKISLLVVASTAFYATEMRDIERLTNYRGPVLNTSHFDVAIPDMENEEIISKIDEVYYLLADQKSKKTYLIVWLAGILHDEDLAYLFESEKEPIVEDENYILHGISDSYYRKQVLPGLYEMRYVTLEKGDIVLDIGAYKGDTAIIFAHRVGREGRVYSFEPVKASYNFLLENIRLNGLQDIVIPVNKGCSDKSGLLRSVSSKFGAHWSFLSEDEEGEEVEVVSIDDFVESNNIDKLDFVKMDVEGWEYNVILGGQNTIKRLNPKVVMSLYHKSSDLLTLPLLMNRIGNYNLYVRCNISGPYSIRLYCKQR